MYLLELAEPGQNCEGRKSFETKKSKYVFKTVIVFKRGPQPKHNPEDDPSLA